MRPVFLLPLLIPAGALAQDNLVFIDQLGRDNAALIDQAGSGNQVGLEDDVALQDGQYNTLRITQTGTGNRVGTLGAGFEQRGNSQTASIFNEVGIDQVSDGNLVGAVSQVAQGAIPVLANRLFVLQSGNGGNRIDRVVQEQLSGMPGQLAEIRQTGTDNRIVAVEQRSLTPAEFSENRIVARFTGRANGTVGLSGPALDAGARSGTLVQTVGDDGLGANGNAIDLLVTGDYNRFGIFQGGRKNQTGLITVNGDSNEFGLRQDGFENDLTATPIDGDGNRIGLSQMGTNRAFLDLLAASSDNEIRGTQIGTGYLEIEIEGDRNALSVRQDYRSGMGGDNLARVTIAGAENAADLQQFGDNLATLTFSGDRNNGAAFSAGMAGAGLGPGLYVQDGMGNAADIGVTGDGNLSAMRQLGDDNLAALSVGGDLNEAWLLQQGSRNSAGLSQTGNRNRARMIQN